MQDPTLRHQIHWVLRKKGGVWEAENDAFYEVRLELDQAVDPWR